MRLGPPFRAACHRQRVLPKESLCFVSHNGALLLLKQSEGRQGTAGFSQYEIAPGSFHVIEAMLEWTHAGELTKNDFNISEMTSDLLYDHLACGAERSRQ